jgi:hypothetical protein
MSTLQCANILFESTANNRISYDVTNGNSFSFFAGGATNLYVNTSSISMSTNNFFVNTSTIITSGGSGLFSNSSTFRAAGNSVTANSTSFNVFSNVVSVSTVANTISFSGNALFTNSSSVVFNVPMSYASFTTTLFSANSAAFGPGPFTALAAVHANGNIYATGDMVSAYSDIRLKTVTGKIENALEKVSLLEGFYYIPNKTAIDIGMDQIDVKRVGVSAQALQMVLPEAVKDAPLGEGYLTVQYERIVPLLIEAIKELKEEIRVLKQTK